MTVKFGTAINCIDGRAQMPVWRWLTETFDLDCVDMVTEPGVDGALAAGQPDVVRSVLCRTRISVEAHGSPVVAVVGHFDCAANPVSQEVHMEHVRQAVAEVKSWNLPVRIVGLWVDENWTVVPVECGVEHHSSHEPEGAWQA